MKFVSGFTPLTDAERGRPPGSVTEEVAEMIRRRRDAIAAVWSPYYARMIGERDDAA